MKTLSLTQPWATAVMLKLKQWETRSWSTQYRGQLAIHAAKGFPRYAREFATVEATLGRIPMLLPFGAIIGTCELVDCQPTWKVLPEIGAIEKMYGDYSEGRYAFKFANVRSFVDPIPARGALGLWTWEPAGPLIYVPDLGTANAQPASHSDTPEVA